MYDVEDFQALFFRILLSWVLLIAGLQVLLYIVVCVLLSRTRQNIMIFCSFSVRLLPAAVVLWIHTQERNLLENPKIRAGLAGQRLQNVEQSPGEAML